MKPICVQCGRFYRMKKQGYCFVEAMPKLSTAKITEDERPRGRGADQYWQPYKIWHGDLWQCHSCGHQLVSGVGSHALAEHYMADFADVLRSTGAAQLQVNDW